MKRWDLNSEMEEISLRFLGNEFHNFGAATLKALPPMEERPVEEWHDLGVYMYLVCDKHYVLA